MAQLHFLAFYDTDSKSWHATGMDEAPVDDQTVWVAERDQWRRPTAEERDLSVDLMGNLIHRLHTEPTILDLEAVAQVLAGRGDSTRWENMPEEGRDEWRKNALGFIASYSRLDPPPTAKHNISPSDSNPIAWTCDCGRDGFDLYDLATHVNNALGGQPDEDEDEDQPDAVAVEAD